MKEFFAKLYLFDDKNCVYFYTRKALVKYLFKLIFQL